LAQALRAANPAMLPLVFAILTSRTGGGGRAGSGNRSLQQPYAVCSSDG